jgi:anti-anti-sigma factor
MDEMMIERSQDPGESGKLTLKASGMVTIAAAAQFKQALQEALEAGPALELDLSGLTQIDLSGLQLLCATHRSAEQAGKQFHIINKGNEVFRNSVADAGFNRHVGCVHDTSQSCLWVGGEH